MRSKSRGTITLQHKDPRRHPLMNPNYMDHDQDWKEFRKCVRMARELFATEAFDPFRGEELAPGATCQSDADIDNFIRLIFHLRFQFDIELRLRQRIIHPVAVKWDLLVIRWLLWIHHQ